VTPESVASQLTRSNEATLTRPRRYLTANRAKTLAWARVLLPERAETGQIPPMDRGRVRVTSIAGAEIPKPHISGPDAPGQKNGTRWAVRVTSTAITPARRSLQLRGTHRLAVRGGHFSGVAAWPST
jgi:hypothetical protein